jgi:Na+/glutamate symporter
MWTSILAVLGNLVGGPFARAAVDAYKAKLQAENTAEKMAADLAARELAVEQRERELDVELVKAEQGNWFTRMVRPLWAMPFVIYTWKVVVWDKVLGLGATDALTGFAATLALTIATAYFGGRTIEKVARIIRR